LKAQGLLGPFLINVKQTVNCSIKQYVDESSPAVLKKSGNFIWSGKWSPFVLWCLSAPGHCRNWRCVKLAGITTCLKELYQSLSTGNKFSNLYVCHCAMCRFYTSDTLHLWYLADSGTLVFIIFAYFCWMSDYLSMFLLYPIIDGVSLIIR